MKGPDLIHISLYTWSTEFLTFFYRFSGESKDVHSTHGPLQWGLHVLCDGNGICYSLVCDLLHCERIQENEKHESAVLEGLLSFVAHWILQFLESGYQNVDCYWLMGVCTVQVLEKFGISKFFSICLLTMLSSVYIGDLTQ